jgi:hypothetical protein
MNTPFVVIGYDVFKHLYLQNIEPVPKLIDYALKRMVLGQALTVFRPTAYKTAFFKGYFPKTEVFGKPP